MNVKMLLKKKFASMVVFLVGFVSIFAQEVPPPPVIQRGIGIGGQDDSPVDMYVWGLLFLAIGMILYCGNRLFFSKPKSSI